MILGRKKRPEQSEPADESVESDVVEEDGEVAESDDVEEDLEDAEYEDEDDESVEQDVDVRAEGPFDASEVDLSADGVTRLPLGPLTITPFEGMGLQFQGDPESQTIFSVLAMHENSGLQLELFAAPTSGGLAEELREDAIEEAQQAGGNAEILDGPFGREIKRVLPIEGPEGEQLFHVSRIWLVDGPRWLLRGTLMGAASLVEGTDAPADVFVEFFRNIIVHRDDAPRVPGELLTLTLPDLPGAEG